MTEAQALELEATYVVANTPEYLYRRLRDSEVVRRLANDFSAELLATMYREVLAKPNRTASDVAQAYAAMVALTLRDYSEWRPLIDGFEITTLDWAERIRAIAKQRATPTVVTSLTASPAKIAAPTLATASNTDEGVAVRPRIVITDSAT